MSQSMLLGMIAETQVHAGAGRSTGVLDLPIQREKSTDWPCIFGSSVKGAMRTKAEDRWSKNSRLVQEIFGPAGDKAHEHAGALAVGDARLLFLPVRSLTGHYRWVTCPALLRRFKRDLERLGMNSKFTFTPPEPIEGSSVSVLQGSDQYLYLEEFRYTVREDPGLAEVVEVVKKLWPDLLPDGQLAELLAVIDDRRFGDLTKFATCIAPHIAINNETKTVKQTGLWYEETLPPETVMYVALHAWGSRKPKGEGSEPGKPLDAGEVMKKVKGDLFDGKRYLQIGGNETVGMGWFKLSFAGAGG